VVFRAISVLAFAAILASAEDAIEVVLRPKGLDANVVNPSEAAVDGKRHLAYLLGRESAALGVLDTKTLALRTVPIPAQGRTMVVYPDTGTVYILHAGTVSVSPPKAEAWKSVVIRESWVMVADPATDGVYIAAGDELLRVGPDATAKTLFRVEGATNLYRIAIDTKRGLVHVVEPQAKPPRVHTRKLPDGAVVSDRDLPIPEDGHALNGFLVHPNSGRLVALFGDGFKGHDNVLQIAPAEKGDFKPFTVKGAMDAQSMIFHPGGDLLFTANDNTGDVSIIDLSKNPPAFVNVKTDGKPNGLSYDRKRDTLWVQTWSTKVVAINVGKRVATGSFEGWSTGHLYKGVAVDEELGRVVAIGGYQGGSCVTVHTVADAKTKTFRTGAAPMDAAWGDGKLWLAMDDERLAVLDPATKAVTDLATPIMMPRAIAFEPKSGQLLVAIGEWVFPNTLYWLDPASKRFTAGPALPRGPIAVGTGSGSAWVLGWADEQLSETPLESKALRKVGAPGTRCWSHRHFATWDKGAVVLRSGPGMIVTAAPGAELLGDKLPDDPTSLAIDAAGNRAWVALGSGPDSGACSVDLTTFAMTKVPFGKGSCDAAFDSTTGAAFFADLADRAVYRVAGEKPERIALPGDFAPDAVAVDPAHCAVYVAARTPGSLALFRILQKDLTVEKVFEGAHPYGADAGKTWYVKCTNTWVSMSRFALDLKASKGALVDYTGGRVVLFTLK
jgi:DNA-binding beta-propeller fold protein YncE